MRIVYSKHAMLRMKERHISAEDVELILSQPDGKIRQSADKWIYYKKFKNRTDNSIATVVVQVELHFWEVITVMIGFEVNYENNP